MVSVSLSIVWVLQGLIVGEVDESGEKSEGNAVKIHDVNPLAFHHHGMDTYPRTDGVRSSDTGGFRTFADFLFIKINPYRYKDKWTMFSPIEKLVILALSTELLVMLRQRFKLTLLRYSRIGHIDFGDVSWRRNVLVPTLTCWRSMYLI